MKAVRVHRFGPPEVIALEDVPKPEPSNGEVVVEVKAAGIGPWDALIRSGKSALPQPLPLVLCSDLSCVIDYRATRFEEMVKETDSVIDTVGVDTLDRSYGVLKRGGIVVSSAAQPSNEKAEHYGVRAVFFLVQVTTERLRKIAELIDAEKLRTEVGEVLWLDEARKGHEMLEGAPHRRGKI